MTAAPNYLQLQEKARQQYEAAWHLFHVTFPSVKDPHLLLGIISNLAACLEKAMEAILAYERQLQLVPAYANTFESKLTTFRTALRRNHLSPEYITLLLFLRELMESHQKSPIEFKRQDRFVIASKDYQLKVVDARDISRYLDQSKEFLTAMEGIINRK